MLIVQVIMAFGYAAPRGSQAECSVRTCLRAPSEAGTRKQVLKPIAQADPPTLIIILAERISETEPQRVPCDQPVAPERTESRGKLRKVLDIKFIAKELGVHCGQFDRSV